MIIWLSIMVGWCSIQLPAEAHQLNKGYSQITIEGRQAVYELFLPEEELPFIDANEDKHVTAEELATGRDRLADYVRQHVELKRDDETLAYRFVSAKLSDQGENPGITMHLEYTSRLAIGDLTVRYTAIFDDIDQNHVNFLTIVNGDDVVDTLFETGTRMHQYKSSGNGSALPTLLQYAWLGIKHIWTGYDHLLFLLSLLILAAGWRDVLRIVTAFTAAHSVTLLLTATEAIRVNSRLVEIAIALSIAYVAAENWFIRRKANTPRYRWLLTFAFGLVHGMGFAGALQETGLPSRYFIGSLLSFNVGIELGQLAIVAVILPFLLRSRLQKWYSPFVLGLSAVIFVFGVAWAIERAY
ncbi:HupE/UreJ family protein [Paenibacillus aceris]|uniref:Hydrogenase/urease accessory protein HupE n=2 Tax=Paenibacillus aceris TaxID=869555 RepID=A0ABS4I5I4_9BACL|nr:HupE/UreJ family protein [Paenibacillus aceris]MBP1966179.1 hydrogenase/urease accessory protein HupE [Paenibacillus aceris]